jgi:dienelactone hydrolase
MQARDLDYRCGETSLRGYLALDENAAGKRPGVLVFHEGLGLGEFAMERARRLAGLGYVALAADMFGDRRQASNLQQSQPWSAGFAPSRTSSAPGAAPRSKRSPRYRRSILEGWRRSGSALAGRWCWSWRARAPS